MERISNIAALVSDIEGNALDQIEENALEQKIPQTPQEIGDFMCANEWIMRTAIRSYRGMQEYEDLFQEACVGAMKGISTYNPNKGSKLTTYVFACAVNEVKMSVRKKLSKKRVATVISIDDSPLGQQDDPLKPLVLRDQNADTEEEAINSTLYNEIMNVVKTKLTYTEQVVVVRHRDGIPQSKTAKELGISQGQVSKILNQSFCKIRLELGLA